MPRYQRGPPPVWVETSKLYCRRGDRLTDSSAALLPVKRSDRWLAQAEVFIESERPSDSTVTHIEAAGLIGLDGCSLVLSRDRKGWGWESRIRFTLNPGPDSPDRSWEIGLENRRAKNWSWRSFTAPGSADSEPDRHCSDNVRGSRHRRGLRRERVGWAIPAIQERAYAAGMGGREGESGLPTWWMKRAGPIRPPFESISAITRAFTREVRNRLALMKFHPAIIRGPADAILVSQRFTFTRSAPVRPLTFP